MLWRLFLPYFKSMKVDLKFTYYLLLLGQFKGNQPFTISVKNEVMSMSALPSPPSPRGSSFIHQASHLLCHGSCFTEKNQDQMSQETACNCCQVKVLHLGLNGMEKEFKCVIFVMKIWITILVGIVSFAFHFYWKKSLRLTTVTPLYSCIQLSARTAVVPKL